MLSACGGRNGNDYEPYENDLTEQNSNGEYENGEFETAEPEIEPPPPDIPIYNEYNISLEIDPSARTVQGISHIEFTNRADIPLDTIVLRVYLNAFGEDVSPPPFFPELEWRVFPNEPDFGYMDIQYAFADNEPLDFILDETILTLNLAEPLKPNTTIQLLLQYNAQIPQMAHRTGSNDYAMWFGMFLPTLAVFGEDGWHTESHYPAGSPFLLETANYRVEITTPSRYVVVGTGLRTEEVIGDTDTKITHFTAHQARDFAFAISPYFQNARISTESGIDIHFYYYTETLLIDEILEISRRTFEHFEEQIGAYPLGHLTIVETDLVEDSFSFSQIVFVDSWYLNRGGRYWGVAHGIGNQWFANIIGTNRTLSPWLTDGLTRFVQAPIFYPTPESLRARMERDHVSIEDRTTLFLYRGLYASPNRAHYAHTHGRKAMLMFYALNHHMGDELFREFLSEYYQQFSFNIATAENFIELAEEIYGNSLHDFFYEWIHKGTVPELP